MRSRKTPAWFAPAVAALLVICAPGAAHGQTFDADNISIGGLVGRTSGLTARAVFADRSARSGPFLDRALDLNASFNLSGFLLITSHVTAERPVENSPLKFFIGPGWAIGSEDNDVFLGGSGNIGVYFDRFRYQVTFQLMPRLIITPDVDGLISAAVGMRVRL